MNGTITTRHVLTHAHMIVRGFGWVVFARAVVAALHLSSRRTFLACVAGGSR
jgi:hypothetical protein